MQTLLFTVFLATFLFTNSVAAAEFSTIEFADQRFTVCRVNVQKEQLRLFHRDETGQPFKRFDRLTLWLESRGQKLVFAINAGMYQKDLSTVGLLVIDRRELAPLNIANGEGNFFLKPNGIFAIADGEARVVESSEYPKLRQPVRLATQSGPLLVRDGKLHPAFNPRSQSRYIRNGVGVPSPDTAIFVISETPVTFHELATLFREKLTCPNALFLDGAISSLHAPELKRSDVRTDLGPIIGVTSAR